MRKPVSRGVALVAGTLVLFINGIVYAWSIYSAPFSENFGWTSAQLGVCFTIVLIMFCIGGFLGSIATGKLGSGKTISLGGLAAAIGYALSLLLNADRLLLLYVCFAIAGLGSGIAYNAVISNVTARFPDKKGTASGVMLMGFGTSTLIMGSVATALISSVGWKMTYVITAILLVVISVGGSIVLAVQPEQTAANNTEETEGLTTGQMVHTPAFWLVFGVATINCFFGFGVLGHARAMAIEGGFAAQTAALIVGLVSVMNGVGRIFYGMLQDKKGYTVSFPVASCSLILAAVLAIVGFSAKIPVMVAIGLMLGGFGNSAGPTIITSLAAEFFGRTHYGRNMSVLNMNMVPGSVGSSVAGAVQTASGSYRGCFIIFGMLEIPALLLVFVLAKLDKKGKAR